MFGFNRTASGAVACMALLGLALLASGCSRERPPPAPAAPVIARAPVAAEADEDPEDYPGQAVYERGKGAVMSRNWSAAVEAFEQAVVEEPEFAEAWYQLGAARTRLAAREVRYDEQHALELFRAGVDAKKTAQALMSMGRYRVWNEEQQAQAWIDLREGLKEVDATLADEPSLLVALHAMGG